MKLLEGTDRSIVDRERSRPDAHRPMMLWPLLTLMGFLSLGGFVGGISLVTDPTGANIGAKLSWLEETAVNDFLLPGLFLLGVYGVVTLVLIVGWLRRPSPRSVGRFDRLLRPRWSRTGTILMGVLLVAWIAYEFTIFDDQMILQPILIGVGALMVLIPLLPSMRAYAAR